MWFSDLRVYGGGRVDTSENLRQWANAEQTAAATPESLEVTGNWCWFYIYFQNIDRCLEPVIVIKRQRVQDFTLAVTEGCAEVEI